MTGYESRTGGEFGGPVHGFGGGGGGGGGVGTAAPEHAKLKTLIASLPPQCWE